MLTLEKSKWVICRECHKKSSTPLIYQIGKIGSFSLLFVRFIQLLTCLIIFLKVQNNKLQFVSFNSKCELLLLNRPQI